MIIDSYNHFSPPEYVQAILKLCPADFRWRDMLNTRFTQMTNVERRIERLDKYKIDKQVAGMISFIDSNVLPLKEEEVVRLCRMFNDGMAEAMHKAHGRIYTTASIPLTSPELEDELNRAVKDLGLKGIFVPSHVHGKPIDQFTSLWEQAEKLDVPVWIHPIDPETSNSRPYEEEYDLMHTFGWLFETTLMASRLVFSGTMQKHPKLKVILHHLGAMIPFLTGRIDETYSARPEAAAGSALPFVNELKKTPMEYFKMFYCDTAVGGSAGAVRLGVETYGTGHVMFGTDYPFGPKGGDGRLETYPSIVRRIMNQLQIPEENQEQVLWKNITSIAKLE